MNKVRKLMLAFACLLCSISLAIAQNITVSGRVTDSQTGEPVSYASVRLKGTTKGVMSDVDGKYNISAPSKGTLIFSSIGSVTQEININGRAKIDVKLATDAVNVEQVVVTASGMTRAQKTVGYATTTVKTEELIASRPTSVTSGLVGKVAGLNITQAGGAGTSQKVVVRGYSSLTGSNQPLYVVDGMPMSNDFTGVGGTDGLNNAMDFGSGSNDINPDDVESITVLKGASATALYGSRAANGVILVTTKKGKQGDRIKVIYDGSFQVSNVLRTPQLQSSFGQGWGYPYYSQNYYGNADTYLGSWSAIENGSWGPALDGRLHEWNIGAHVSGLGDLLEKPYSYAKNSVRHFYANGYEMSNNINISGGVGNTGFYASYGNTYSNGILPGDKDYYERNTFNFRGNTKLFKEWAWFNYGITFTRTDNRGAMMGQGSTGSTIYQDILQYPVDIDYSALKDYNSVYNNPDNFYTPYAKNPWWIVDNNYASAQTDNVFGFVELGSKIIDGLSAKFNLNGNFSNIKEKYFNNLYTFASDSFNGAESTPEVGSYREVDRRRNQIDASFLLVADYKFGKDFSFNATAGANYNQRVASRHTGELQGLSVPGWASFDNSSGATPVASHYQSKRRLIGLLAEANIGFRDYLFFGASVRNDWSSTLPIHNNDFLYWGVNASAILTDMFKIKSDNLNFLKLRVAYGKTGNDADMYQTSTWYVQAQPGVGFGDLTFPIGGVNGFRQNTVIPSNELKPEITTETEVGLEARFFKNRLRLDFSAYNRNTKDQIMSSTIAPETGYTSGVVNVGKINNKGIEFMVGVTPVKTKDFSWDMNYTFTKNWSKVKELTGASDDEEFQIYGLSSSVSFVAKVGQPLGVFTYNKYETVTDKKSEYYGSYIVNNNTGFPLQLSEKEIIGKSTPDFIMGLTNKFTYKNISLGITVDWRKGGSMYSKTNSILYFVGNHPETAFNDRNSFIMPNSVRLIDGKYVENNIPVDMRYGNVARWWYSNYNSIMNRRDLISKSYFKLREVNLTYSMPRKWFTKSNFITGIDVSVVGRNLFVWTHSQQTIDPETTNYGNDLTSEYGEYYASPSTRTFGGSIKVIF